MSTDKIKKILEIDSDPKNAIFELSESKVDKDEFKVHADGNHSEHEDLYSKIEEVELTPGEQGEEGKPGKPGIDGEPGKPGLDGKPGKESLQGNTGPPGPAGKPGIQGIDGNIGENGIGLTPEHEWKGTSLRFKNEDGIWGEWRNLQGVEGLKGSRSLGGHSEYYIDQTKIGSSQTFNFSTGIGLILTNASGDGRTGVDFKADLTFFDNRYYTQTILGSNTNGEGASLIGTEVANFNNQLSSSDTDVQKALETLDDLPIVNFFNGTFRETFDATVASDGSIVTMSLEQSGTGDLTEQFSDGITILDCTPPQTIVLTAGSDTNPQSNWVYVLKSTKALTLSTSAWPTEEHIKVAFFFVQSAADVQTDGGTLVNQNWNDHLQGTDGQGHLAHIGTKIRALQATYFSGIAGNGTDEYLTPTAGNTEFKSTSGVVDQMHMQTFPAFDTSVSDVMHIKNWFGDSFHSLTNLYDIVADSTGATIGNNKWFNVVFWGVMNKSGTHQTVMTNLPKGFYNTQLGAEEDSLGHDDFTIPREFNIDSSTGFLIARVTIQMKTGGGTWVVGSTVDLRGTSPQTASGGAASNVTIFADNTFEIFDNLDNTKELVFDVGTLVTTGNVRTITMADADVDLTDIGTNTTAIALNTTHRSSDGSDHGFIDQSVISGATPVFTGTNITGLPAASVLAGTFGTGAYVMDTSLAVPQLGPSGDTDLLSLASGALTVNGDITVAGNNILDAGGAWIDSNGSGNTTFAGNVFLPTGDLTIIDTGAEPIKVKRNYTGSARTSTKNVVKLVAEASAGNMGNGFGGSQLYVIEDDTSGEIIIGQMRWFRDGSDTIGGFAFSAGDGGNNDILTLNGDLSADFAGDLDVVGDLTAGTIKADDGFTGSWVNAEGDTVNVVSGIITSVVTP